MAYSGTLDDQHNEGHVALAVHRQSMFRPFSDSHSTAIELYDELRLVQ